MLEKKEKWKKKKTVVFLTGDSFGSDGFIEASAGIFECSAREPNFDE